MNIWIFNHYATAPTHVGGTRHFDLARHLCERGHDVTIFASSFNHFSKKEMVFGTSSHPYQTEWIDGVKYVWVNTPGYENAIGRGKNILSYTFKSYKKAVADCKNERPDIVIGSSVHPLAAIVGFRVARKAKCKFYFEERDLWPQTFVDFGKISAKNPLALALYKLESFLYKKSDRIIVLFDKAKDYVTSKGFDEKKVIYLPNGVNFSRYEHLEESDEVNRIFKGLENKFVIVYTGSHGIANHLQPMIKLFSILKNNSKLHLLMVGDGAHKKELINMAQKEKIQNISFEQSIPKSSIPFLLSKAHVGIISILDSPLYKWGFSMNKLYDYMAAGLPIAMITNRQLIGTLDGVKGIHASEDLNEIAEVINEYSKSPEKMSEKSRCLKEYVKNHYSWETLSGELEKEMIKDIKDMK